MPQKILLYVFWLIQKKVVTLQRIYEADITMHITTIFTYKIQ